MKNIKGEGILVSREKAWTNLQGQQKVRDNVKKIYKMGNKLISLISPLKHMVVRPWTNLIIRPFGLGYVKINQTIYPLV